MKRRELFLSFIFLLKNKKTQPRTFPKLLEQRAQSCSAVRIVLHLPIHLRTANNFFYTTKKSTTVCLPENKHIGSVFHDCIDIIALLYRL